MSRLSVHFSGLTERSGPLAFGLANILRSITSEEEQTRDILPMVFEIPDLPADRVLAYLRVLLERHESLRTTYRFEPEPTQHVAGSGELAVEVVEAEGEGGSDAATEAGIELSTADATLETAVRTANRLRLPRFELSEAPPLRVAVVTRGGLARHLVWVVSHAAMDAATCEILLREWTALTAGRPLPEPGPQPLDVVGIEQQSSVRRLTASALGFWRDQLAQVPQAMLPLPAGTTPEDTGRHPGLRVRSQAAMAHLAAISARTGASSSMIVMAAVNALVCHYSSYPVCVTTSLSGNRVLRQLRDYFGSLSQDALLTVPVPEDGSFDELIRRVRAAALSAYRASWFDPALMWATITDACAERGFNYARDLVFNDMSGLSASTSGDVVARGAVTRLPDVWIPRDDELVVTDPELAARLEPQPALDIPTRFVVYVYRLDTELDVIMHADPRCLDAAALAALGASLLRLLRAAAERDVPLKELAEISTLEPAARGRDWVYTDSCWLERSATRALVAEVLGDRPHLVAFGPDRVVCHLAGPADPDLLADLHRRCVAALPGRETVMAPHEYVVCATAPVAAPDDPDQWAALPVTLRGTGRASGSGSSASGSSSESSKATNSEQTSGGDPA